MRIENLGVVGTMSKEERISRDHLRLFFYYRIVLCFARAERSLSYRGPRHPRITLSERRYRGVDERL
jgi:hypothetical protein